MHGIRIAKGKQNQKELNKFEDRKGLVLGHQIKGRAQGGAYEL